MCRLMQARFRFCVRVYLYDLLCSSYQGMHGFYTCKLIPSSVMIVLLATICTSVTSWNTVCRNLTLGISVIMNPPKLVHVCYIMPYYDM
jgi:hypothetical protein